MTPTTRSLVLVESGRLKLAALARLAEGGREARYDACVLFLAAARAERRALDAMGNPSRQDRLMSAVEICGCLIDGLYPSAVFEWAWGKVLDASEGLAEADARVIRSKVDQRFASFLQEYNQTLKRLPRTTKAISEGAPTEDERELQLLVNAYPGDPRLWSLLAMAHRRKGAVADAWAAIQRTRKLDPEDTVFRSAEIELVVDADPRKAAAVLESVYRDVMAGANADVCFGFVSAAMRLGVRKSGRVWLERALDATTVAMSRPQLHPKDYSWFRAFHLMCRELLAGRKPGIDILYRTGFGDKVTMAATKDPVEILLQYGTQLRAA